MNSMKQTGILITAIIILVSVFSCAPPDTGSGDIPKPSMSIPGALTGSSSRALSRATGAGGAAENFFEPFRNSLALGADVLDFVYEVIDSINSSAIPDSWEGTTGEGDYVSVTTDSSRTYSKRIEFRSTAGAASPYLQINYNPGSIKGEIYYSEEDSANNLEKIKVFYDETGTYPVLKAWVAIKDGTETYPTGLYFNATKNSAGRIVVEGGVAYHFVFGGSSTWPTDNTSNRTYMYKALCSGDGSKAEVALYFPESNVSASIDETMNIKNTFLDIIFEWVETDNGADLDSALGQTSGTITDGTTLGTVLGSYSGSGDDDIEFVLNLTNNIAYSDANGYEGNENNTTTPFPSAFDMGDLSGIGFSLSPSGIAALTNASSVFTFPTN